MDRYEAIPHHPDADTFDFRRSWEGIKQACLGHKRLVLLTCALTVSVVLAYVLIWPPVYQSHVVLVADANDDIQRDTFYQTWNVFRKDHLPDEVQMITASPVLEEVVDRLNLGYDDVYHPFLSHAAYLWTESWVGRNYRRVKDWVFPREPNPYSPTPEQIERARVINDFRKGISLSPIPETNVGRLVVRGPSPRVAEIANTVAQVYLEQRRARHTQEAENAYQSLAGEVEKARTELLAHEQRMKDFASQNNMLLMFEKDKVEIGRWLELKASVVELESSIASLESSLRNIDQQLTSEDREVVTSRAFQTNSVHVTLRERLSSLEFSRSQTLLRYREDSPEVRDLDEQIAAVKAQMAQEPEVSEFQTMSVISQTYEQLRNQKSQLEAQLSGKRAELVTRRKAVAQMSRMVDSIPEKMKASHELNREHSVLEKKYLALQEKLTIAAVSKATAQSAPPSLRVVEIAAAPEKATWPKTKLLVVLAVFFGLGAGVVLALIIQLLYGRVSRYRLSRARDELPIYAIVEQDREYAAQLFSLSVPRRALTRRWRKAA